MSHAIPDTHTLVFSTTVPAGSRVYIGGGLFYETGTDIVLTVAVPVSSPNPLSDTGVGESERASG